VHYRGVSGVGRWTRNKKGDGRSISSGSKRDGGVVESIAGSERNVNMGVVGGIGRAATTGENGLCSLFQGAARREGSRKR